MIEKKKILKFIWDVLKCLFIVYPLTLLQWLIMENLTKLDNNSYLLILITDVIFIIVYLYFYKKSENKSINHSDKDYLLKKWKEEKRMSQEIIDMVDNLLNNFIHNVIKTSEVYNNKNENIDYLLKNFIIELNQINDRFHFIHEIESEELIEYINYLLLFNQCNYNKDIIDKYRRW